MVKFDEDKTKFDPFWAEISSCVDKGSESSGIKVLRLESCSVGKVAHALEGLDCSEAGYNCASSETYLQDHANSGVKRLAPPSSRFLEMITKLPELRLHNSPERVFVAIFDGDQTIFDSFWAVFSSCVDKGSKSSGIQMLRLELYLSGQFCSYCDVLSAMCVGAWLLSSTWRTKHRNMNKIGRIKKAQNFTKGKKYLEN